MKYVGFVLRADNQGEGGILALLALTPAAERAGPAWSRSASSARRSSTATASSRRPSPCWRAVGGPRGRRPRPRRLGRAGHPRVPASPSSRSRSGARPGVGAAVRPGHAGLVRDHRAARAAEVARNPGVLRALNPWHAVRFLAEHGIAGFLVLGAVVLAVTGAEALYADMGHFGRRPIRRVWFAARAPGPPAQLLRPGRARPPRSPQAVQNPFYLLAPRAAALPAPGARHARRHHRLPGADLRRLLAHPAGGPARLLPARDHRPHLPDRSRPGLPAGGERRPHGRLPPPGPRLPVVQRPGRGLRDRGDRDDGHHQRALLPGRAPSLALAALARGPRPDGRSSSPSTSPSSAANLVKVEEGGWVPLASAGRSTCSWRRGTAARELLRAGRWPESPCRSSTSWTGLRRQPPVRVPGTAVFLTRPPGGQRRPCSSTTSSTTRPSTRTSSSSPWSPRTCPRSPARTGSPVEALGSGPPPGPRVLRLHGDARRAGGRGALLRAPGRDRPPDETSYYLGRTRLLPAGPAPMAKWRKLLFGFMARNAALGDGVLPHAARPRGGARRARIESRRRAAGAPVTPPGGGRRGRRRSRAPRAGRASDRAGTSAAG